MRQQLQEQNGELEAWRDKSGTRSGRRAPDSAIAHSAKAPTLPGWEVAATYRPVIQVGGDIYGWLRMADGRTLFWIADATGHGAAAALLTTLAKLLFQHGSVEHTQPAAIMEAVNNDFRSIFGARSFMTAMCVALDPANGAGGRGGRGSSAASCDPARGPAELVASSAPPLGLLERSHFEETRSRCSRATDFSFTPTDSTAPRKAKRERWTPERFARARARRRRERAGFARPYLHTQSPDRGEPLPDDLAAVAVRRAKNRREIFSSSGKINIALEKGAINQPLCPKPLRKKHPQNVSPMLLS